MTKRIHRLERDCSAQADEIDKLDAQYEEIVRKNQENDDLERTEHVELVAGKKKNIAGDKERLWELLYNIN